MDSKDREIERRLQDLGAALDRRSGAGDPSAWEAVREAYRKTADPMAAARSGAGSRGWTVAAVAAAAALVAVSAWLHPDSRSRTARRTHRTPAPAVLSYLPRTGNYATADGAVQRWVVRRAGRRMTLSEYDAAVSATTPMFIYDFRIENGCLEQLDVRNSKGIREPERFPWYCVPVRRFQDAYDNADYHVTEQGTETMRQVAGVGRVLTVTVEQRQGGKTYLIRRTLAPGRGLLEETASQIGKTAPSVLAQVSGAGFERPIQATLQDVPFGSLPQHIRCQLLAPAGLPFTTYIPLALGTFGSAFTSQAIHVGNALGIIFGDLAHHAMLTEFVWLPKTDTLAQAEASLALAEHAYPHLTWAPDAHLRYRAYSWAIREYTGTDPHDATDVGGADIGRHAGHYFYLIRTGWYESVQLPVLSAWRWSDGTTLTR
jgi:hypothetical protein